MLLTNMTDINDEWIEWYRQENPGTSYAKAIHTALAQMTEEYRKLKAVVDKYSINRY
jgi:hypothetical protein